MKLLWTNAVAVSLVLGAASAVIAKNVDRQGGPGQLTNVSYDPTRELYRDLDAQFSAEYQASTGRKMTIAQSHGGSTRQARAVADGLDADVVTLAIHSDIELLRKRGLVTDGWSNRLPHDSLPYTSTIVFVVRKGNPHAIHDWPDLVCGDLSIVTPSPKTSGNGKLAFVAAWGSVIQRGGDEAAARSFVSEVYRRVVELDPGSRAATLAFSEEKIGDVHLTWENEALREVGDSAGELAIVYPSASIRAEPYVAWVDANVDRKGTRALARKYLEYLFTDEGQEIIAEHGYRPYREDIARKHLDRLPSLQLFPVTLVAKDWEDAQEKFFAEGGIFEALERTRTK